MIIKSFTAPTIASALKQVREELGGEAIVLRTRVCPEEEVMLTGNKFEVTACVDGKVLQAEKSKAIKDEITPENLELPQSTENIIMQTDGVDDRGLKRIEKTLNHILNSHRSGEIFGEIDPRVKPVHLDLLDADIPVEIAARISKNIAGNIDPDKTIDEVALDIVKSELTILSTANVRIEPGSTVAFIGPSGAGKTSAVGKAAAQLCSSFKQKIKLVSLDNLKVSSHEEIATYSQLLDLPLEVVEKLMKHKPDDSIILVDTPAISLEPKKQEEQINRLKALEPDMVFLVFSAASRSNDLIDTANIFEAFAPDYLVAGHLDETDRWGGVLTMAEYLNIPLAFVADSPGGFGCLKSADPEKIARKILKMEGSAV